MGKRRTPGVIVQRTSGMPTDIVLGRPANTRADASGSYTLEDIIAEFSGTPGERVRSPYRNSIIAHICIASIARAIAQAPLQLKTVADELIEDPAHPILRVLEHPNGLQRWTSFLYRTLVAWYEDGIVHWIDPAPSAGGTAEMPRGARQQARVARRHEMTPAIKGGILTGWTYRRQGSGNPQFIPLEHTATLRFEDPDDELDGLPPHVPVLRAVVHHNLSMEFNNAAMRNGGEVGTIYQTEQHLQPDQVQALRESIAARHLGADKHRLFAILHGGLKIDRGTDALRDIDNLNGMRLDAELIGATYGVTPIMRGDYTNATYSNAREQKLLFWEITGLFVIESIEAAANVFFLRGERSRYKLEFFLEAIPELKWRAMQYASDALALTAHNVGRNEINRRWDIGLEDQPWGEEPLVGAGLLPISVVVGDAEMAVANDRLPEGEIDDGETIPGEPGEPGGRAGKTNPPRRRLRHLVDEAIRTLRDEETQTRDEERASRRQQATHRAWVASWASLRRAGTIKMRAFFKAQSSRLKKRLADALPGNALPTERDDQQRDANDIIERVLYELRETDGESPEDRRLRAAYQGVLRDGVELGGAQIARELSDAAPDYVWSMDAPDVARHLDEQMIRVRRVNATTRDRVRRVLSAGLAEGQSLTELSERIDKAIGADNSARGYTIAQTELHEAISAGRDIAMRQAGVDGKAWLTSGLPVKSLSNPDGVVRLAHKYAEVASRDGIPLDQPFVLINTEARGKEAARETARYPGDANLSPGNRINCACVQVARTLRRSSQRQEGGVLPLPDRFLTYAEMLANREAQRSGPTHYETTDGEETES